MATPGIRYADVASFLRYCESEARLRERDTPHTLSQRPDTTVTHAERLTQITGDRDSTSIR